MSGDSVGHQRKHFTVAELIARERAAAAPYQRQIPSDPTQNPLPVTELFRREGIDFAGNENPTAEMASVPVHTPIHVTELLRRESDQPETSKHKPGRIATIGSAAALCGLTIAGLIALKPTFVSSPVGGLPSDQELPSGSTPIAQAPGSVDPTGTVLRRAASSSSTEPGTGSADGVGAAQQGGSAGSGGATGSAGSAGSAGQSSSGSSGGTVSAPVTTTSPTAAPAPPSGGTGGSESPSEPQPRDDKNDGSDDGSGKKDSGVLDPVTEPVCGLLDPVCQPLDPVIGTVNGTLGGLLG